MPDITEIYVARGNQEIREGELSYSDVITTRDDAEADAAAHCKRDPKIQKIAYYRVREDGSFKKLLVFENPNINTGPRRMARPVQADPVRKPRSRKAPPPQKEGLFDKVLSVLKD